jgi:hypothetical protein
MAVLLDTNVLLRLAHPTIPARVTQRERCIICASAMKHCTLRTKYRRVLGRNHAPNCRQWLGIFY